MDSIIGTFTYQVCTCIERLMGKLMGISLILHFYLYTWSHLELKQKPKHLQCNLTMPNLINEITLTCLSAENQMLLYHSLLLLHWCFLRQRCNITHTGTKRDKGRLRHEAGKTKKNKQQLMYWKLWVPSTLEAMCGFVLVFMGEDCSCTHMNKHFTMVEHKSLRHGLCRKFK